MQDIPALLLIAAYFVFEFMMFKYVRNRKGLIGVLIEKYKNREYSSRQ
jgi:hypothetical protein